MWALVNLLAVSSWASLPVECPSLPVWTIYVWWPSEVYNLVVVSFLVCCCVVLVCLSEHRDLLLLTSSLSILPLKLLLLIYTFGLPYNSRLSLWNSKLPFSSRTRPSIYHFHRTFTMMPFIFILVVVGLQSGIVVAQTPADGVIFKPQRKSSTLDPFGNSSLSLWPERLFSTREHRDGLFERGPICVYNDGWELYCSADHYCVSTYKWHPSRK